VFGKTLPFRLYAQILIFSALVALGALILWPLQQTLYSGMVSIRDNLINRLERQIGRKIRYSSISPSLFGSFDVRNISIMGRDDIPLLTMSRFRITYSLLDILRGRTLAIRSVQIDSPFVNYNTAIDNDLLDLFRTAGQEGSSRVLADMLPKEIVIRIRNGKCQVLSGANNFAFDSLDFNAEIFEKSVVINGKWNISVSIAKLFSEPVHFQIAMKANGLYKIDMEYGTAVIAIPSVTGDMSGAQPVVFNASMREGAFNIYKKPDIFPFDISFEYRKDGKGLEGRLSCNDFRLAQLISFSGGMEGLRPMLDVASSGKALIERGNGGAFSYSVNMAGSAPSDPALQDEPSQTASYEIDISGNEKLAQIEKLRFSMPHDLTRDASFYGDAGFTGAVAFHPFAPEGILSLGSFSISGREDLNADIAVNTEGSRINMSCEKINIGRGAVGIAANVSLEPSENGMIFSASMARSADKNYGSAQERSIELKGSLDSGFRSVNAKLSLNSFPAGDLAGLAALFVKELPLPDVLMKVFNDTAITTEMILYTDFKQVSYNTPRLVFSGRSGDRGFSGFASVNGTGSRFELDKGQIRRGEEIMRLSAQADFARKNNISFLINAGYQNLSCLVKGTVLDGKTVNIQGSFGLVVNIIKTSRRGAYSGVIRTEGFPVPFLGKPASLSLSAKLRYDSSQAWSMDFDRLELADIASPAGLAQFKASCHADQKGLKFTQLYYKDDFGPLSGNVNLLWTANFSEITGAAFLLENRENYHMDVSYSDRRLDFKFSGSSMRLGRFSEKAKSLQADGEMRLLRDSAGSFNADFNLSSIRGKILERDININAQAVMDSDELTVRRIAFSTNSFNGEIPQIVVNNKSGTAGSRGDLKLFFKGKRTQGSLSLNANFNPVNSWIGIGDALIFFNGKAHFENFRIGDGAAPQAFDIVFTRGVNGNDTGGAKNDSNSLIVSGGPRNMIRLQVDNNGNFYAGLSSPSPVRGTAIGNISGKKINASCNDLYVDMDGLFKLLPERKDIFLTGGYVNASLDIRGAISDPEFFGRARGTSLRFMIPSYIPVELRPIPFNVAIEGNEITFGPVSASAGNGAGSVSGRFLIDRWIPDIFNIDITVPRETSIPYRLGISGFTARGDASGKLNVSMESRTLDVSGDVYVNNTTLGINSDEIANSQRQGFNDVENHSVVDLTISTGPVVEFYYPDFKFPIIRANADMGTKFHVTADTLTRQYSLTSDIKIRGGEIFYFERSFYIRSGLLVFRENELRFAPRLTARAETRDRNEDGPVTISMIVENAPLMDFTARFESSPALSQMEILALMGQSITGSQIDENAGTSQKEMALINSTADIFAQFTVGRLFERQVRNFLQLDMFSFRTQVLQNLFFRGTGLMQQPVDRNGLGNYFDNTTIFGGKYIGQDLFIQGMLSMRYDANKNTFGGLTFKPDIGLELQGPVVFNNYNFRIRWDFVPEHPENWYANDNSITITFSRSF
jgi:translocation and assembly module TamB